MLPPPFRLERFFAAHEFTARFLLSASDCESLTLDEVLRLADNECRQLWSGLKLGYTESQGLPLLREEVSRLYGTIAPADSIIAAPEEAIFIAMHAMLRPGDEVVVVTPAYQSLFALAESIGCRVLTVPLREGSGRWKLELDRLLSLVTAQTRMLVVNFPHNPTGILPAREEWERLIAHARAQGTYVFSDEMYRLLEFEPASRLPAACDVYERGISLSGLSKVFGLPGLRIGWLAAHDRKLLEAFQVVKDYTTICSSAPSEVLAVIALRAREELVSRNLTLVRHNLEAAGRFFSGHADRFVWLPPQAGPVALPRLLGNEPAESFSRRALAELGVMIVPGGLLDAGGMSFRLGLGRKNLPEVLDLLDAWPRLWKVE